MKRTYETCGKPFTTRKAAERYARNIANASGIRVPVYETTDADVVAPRMMKANHAENAGELHGHDHEERLSCSSAPRCEPITNC